MAIDEIKELIELDMKIQENLEIRHREKNTLKLNLETEKKEVSELAWKEIKAKVASSKQELDEKMKNAQISNKKYLEDNINKLERIYNENFEKWVDEIVDRCIN